MKLMIKITIGALLLTLSSCGTHEQKSQVNNYSYIQIIGEINKEKLVLNNQLPIKLSSLESFKLGGEVATKIRIKQGRHRVTIYRGKEIILDRAFYVSPGNTFELELP